MNGLYRPIALYPILAFHARVDHGKVRFFGHSHGAASVFVELPRSEKQPSEVDVMWDGPELERHGGRLT